MSKVCCFVGLDLGQANDFTALAVLARPLVDSRKPWRLRRPPYTLGHLERFHMGTPYREIFAGLREMLCKPPLYRSIVAVDITGVGQAVVNHLKESLLGPDVHCLLCTAAITSGQAAGDVAGVGWCIPKKELVGVLQVFLQNRRLQIPRTLPHATLLVEELEKFKMKVKAPRADQSLEDWREGPHDDLVFAVGLAAYYGEMALPC
jgi:hypothetical protein